MEELQLLEQRIGGRWTGFAFHDDNGPKENLAKRPMRLCEAIKESYTQPIVLTQELISCPGALRSLGWATHLDEKIARKIAEATGTRLDTAQKFVTNTPHLNGDHSGEQQFSGHSRILCTARGGHETCSPMAASPWHGSSCSGFGRDGRVWERGGQSAHH